MKPSGSYNNAHYSTTTAMVGRIVHSANLVRLLSIDRVSLICRYPGHFHIRGAAMTATVGVVLAT